MIRRTYDKNILFAGGLIGLTLVSGAMLSGATVAADDVVDLVNINIPVSCSLAGTNLLHTAEINNGHYDDEIGSATITATCNDTSGFAIYAIGFTGDTDGNNKMSDNTLGAEYDIATGKYVRGTTTDSVWAMKLTPVSGTYTPTIRNDAGYNYTDFEVVPAEYTKVVSYDAATDVGTGAMGSNFTTNYAVYVSNTQAAGTYEGKVKFTLVHPEDAPAPFAPSEVDCEAGKVCYNANVSPVEVNGQMGKQTTLNASDGTAITNGSFVTLWASNFSRAGYGFAGWNDKYDMSGTTYGPNQTITAPDDVETKGLSLYAKWIKSAGSMQEFTDQKCLGMSTNDVTALTDERDGNTYAIARLADGKCWMIENLRLADKDASNNDIELSNTNTHNPSLPLTNSWWYSSTNDSNTKPTSNKLSSSVTPTTTAWCTTNSSNCDDQSMLYTGNITDFTTNTSSTQSSNIYSYGNYYNWYSATAGHGKYGSSYGSGYIAPGDICPVGWHLPTGGSATAEFGALDVAMGGTGASQSTTEASNRWRTYPNNFVYSGFVYGSSVNSRGSYGDYWSSSANSSYLAYYLSFGSSGVGPGTNSSYKYNGSMVRCVSGV